MDVTTFLNGELKVDVYMKGMLKMEKNTWMICKLKKSII